MYRGTTPTLTFTLPFDVSELAVYYITIAQQYGKSISTIIEKSTEDCTEDGQVITCVLTQEDTLKLYGEGKVLIQVRARTAGGTALASKMFQTTAAEILKDGVI